MYCICRQVLYHSEALCASLHVTHCNSLQHAHTLQHTATHCNTLQHAMTHRYEIQNRVHVRVVVWLSEEIRGGETTKNYGWCSVTVDGFWRRERVREWVCVFRRVSFLVLPRRIHNVPVYCIVLQCVAMCCSVLQGVAVWCSALQCVLVVLNFLLSCPAEVSTRVCISHRGQRVWFNQQPACMDVCTQCTVGICLKFRRILRHKTTTNT